MSPFYPIGTLDQMDNLDSVVSVHILQNGQIGRNGHIGWLQCSNTANNNCWKLGWSCPLAQDFALTTVVEDTILSFFENRV